MGARILIAVAALAGLLCCAALCAACPDTAVCGYRTRDVSVPVGELHTRTCWRFLHGCKPWNCEGNNTDTRHWIGQCREHFERLDQLKSGETIYVEFPGGYSD